MKMMIQVKTSVKEAEKFIRQLATQGYTANRKDAHVSFTDNMTGKITDRYAVSVFEREAFIGVRPE